MWRRSAVPLLVLPLAGCLPALGEEARPAFALESVERQPRPAAAVEPGRPAGAPGARGYLFADSAVAVRARANLESIRVRLWNRGRAPVRVAWDSVAAPPAPAAACPEAFDGWRMRWAPGPADTAAVAPGGSREMYVTPAVRVRTPAGDGWRAVRLPCLVYDPAEPRVPLRLELDTPAGRLAYVLWFRLVRPPR
ncbi:MAG TPA: hypothetical protein VFQ45_01740 [Longimicrobium sp.]|nr:hypothetical protein [Longimicrobium sp.]